MDEYDSREDTLKHIECVANYIHNFRYWLYQRALEHDASKLESFEKPYFDRLTPRLKTLTYGSDEYKQSLKELEVALFHHYKYNSHHPEHYDNGVDGMDLYDIIEMYCDWKAAVKRTANGDMNKSLDINEKRFNISPQLMSILRNTYSKDCQRGEN